VHTHPSTARSSTCSPRFIEAGGWKTPRNTEDTHHQLGRRSGDLGDLGNLAASPPRPVVRMALNLREPPLLAGRWHPAACSEMRGSNECGIRKCIHSAAQRSAEQCSQCSVQTLKTHPQQSNPHSSCRPTRMVVVLASFGWLWLAPMSLCLGCISLASHKCQPLMKPRVQPLQARHEKQKALALPSRCGHGHLDLASRYPTPYVQGAPIQTRRRVCR